MKEQVLEMLEALQSDDEPAQLHAVLNLSLLVERALIPALAKRNSEMLKDLNLLDLDVSGQEADAILDKICQVVFDADVSMGIRVSMVGLLGKFARMNYLEANMRFLAANYHALSNQDAYSTLAALNPGYFGKEHQSEIRALFKKYDIVKVLGELERKDDNLEDAIFGMWVKIRNAELLDELDEPARAQYLKAVLRDLARHYKLMYNDDICGMLKLIPPAFFDKVSGKEVQSLLREYNVLEIFNELEGRTYDDVKQEFERECPPDLLKILEEGSAEEAKNRLREQKYHIELKKAIECLRAQIAAQQD